VAISEQLLRRACEAAREAWPEIVFDEARFRDYLLERVPEDETLRWADLWLACGCVDRIPAAIAALERWGFPSVDDALAKVRMSDDDRAEIKQRLRDHLLVAEDGRLPRLAGYAGRGDLRGYLRITATRLALNYLRDLERRESPAGDQLPEAIVEPELRELAARYRDACEAALGDALEQLGRRERVLLRQHLIDGVTIHQLATRHGVHRVTISRWLEDARELVMTQLTKLLRERHGIGDTELASVLRVVRSRLDVSLPRRLADTETG
jgi:RNA polymerase sigma-70 factor (ECF subfamily)